MVSFICELDQINIGTGANRGEEVSSDKLTHFMRDRVTNALQVKKGNEKIRWNSLAPQPKTALNNVNFMSAFDTGEQ